MDISFKLAQEIVELKAIASRQKEQYTKSYLSFEDIDRVWANTYSRPYSELRSRTQGIYPIYQRAYRGVIRNDSQE